jgi:hypothetical protein
MQKKEPARGQPALSSKLNARGSVESQYENDIRGNAISDLVGPHGTNSLICQTKKICLPTNSTPKKENLKYIYI